ncbi:hypothetical protein WT27_04125 [Burkholderia territorii]|uniref:Serine protease n=2 Tax=Burkholderia territorii TaxID=1503055 RepID=A0A106E5F3_9BURK|nr:hypothetical protein WT27_04125 [Burkholderia territorii]KVX41342.1 hypothetical protein WT31_29565 [Burkholderia territorii]
MGMQDITGHFALPLARPYTDVPPPYGRRRMPFVKSKRPRPGVFDLRVVRGATEASRVEVRATDFGSDNRPWVKPKAPRRRWRPTLLALIAGLAFGSVGFAATRLFDAGKPAASPHTVYEAAIAVQPAETVVTTLAAANVAPDSPPPAANGAVAVALQTSSAPQADVRAADALATPVSAAKPAVSRRKKATVAVPDRAAAFGGAPAHAAAAKPAVQRQREASVEPVPSAADAVGMTAAEFSRWLDATRESSRAAAAPAPSNPDALRVGLTNQTRLTDR